MLDGVTAAGSAAVNSGRRLVVKVGSSSVTSGNGRLDVAKMARLAQQIWRLRRQYGCQVVLVSSGAVAAGTERLGWDRRVISMPEKQAAAAVGQGLLIDTYGKLFHPLGVPIGQVLLTRSDVEDAKRLGHICDTMETLLQHGVLPIVNENDTVAVDEIRFGDNDTLAALVARVVGADLLVLLTDVDGLYTADPRKHPEARHIQDIWSITDALEQVAGDEGSVFGTGGMQTKLAAAKIAAAAGIDVVVAASEGDDVLERAIRGEPVGTLFHADRQAGGRQVPAEGRSCRDSVAASGNDTVSAGRRGERIP
ncbi:MAG: glutamate 5-kinase [Alicyclobacillaceae bacterium]|nr:glutamate 5-kinase [Alicyclobacillaceae bacterium]